MANNITKLRKEKKFTLGALADKLGVSESYMYVLERKKAIAAEHRNNLAQILGAKADDVASLDEKAIIRTRRGVPRAKASGKGADIAALVVNVRDAVQDLAKAIGGPKLELLSLMAKMTPAHQKALVSLARSLSNR